MPSESSREQNIKQLKYIHIFTLKLKSHPRRSKFLKMHSPLKTLVYAVLAFKQSGGVFPPIHLSVAS